MHADIRQARGMHPMTLAWGQEMARRFSASEAVSTWRALEPLDKAMQSDAEQYLPGFQGGPTHYFFEKVPREAERCAATLLPPAYVQERQASSRGTCSKANAKM